jgi:hypothetical protein
MANVGRGLVSRSHETQLEKMQISISESRWLRLDIRKGLIRIIGNCGTEAQRRARDHYAKHGELEE